VEATAISDGTFTMDYGYGKSYGDVTTTMVTIMITHTTRSNILEDDQITDDGIIDYEEALVAGDIVSWLSPSFPDLELKVCIHPKLFQVAPIKPNFGMRLILTMDIHIHGMLLLTNFVSSSKIQRIHSFQPIHLPSWTIWDPFLMSIGDMPMRFIVCF
jgi:hypothetical protein